MLINPPTKRKYVGCHIHWSHIKYEFKRTGNIWPNLWQLTYLSHHWCKKDLLKITKKENQKPQRSGPSHTNGQLLSTRTNSKHQHGERYNQLNLKFQETLDRCAPEKIVQRTEKPPKLWFNHTPCVHVFTLVLMLCISYLDYSNGMLYGSTKKLLQKY